MKLREFIRQASVLARQIQKFDEQLYQVIQSFSRRTNITISTFDHTCYSHRERDDGLSTPHSSDSEDDEDEARLLREVVKILVCMRQKKIHPLPLIIANLQRMTAVHRRVGDLEVPLHDLDSTVTSTT